MIVNLFRFDLIRCNADFHAKPRMRVWRNKLIRLTVS